MTVYIDNNATTPLAEPVLEVMLPWLQESYANPSSPYGPGRRAARAMWTAREQVARLIGASPSDIVFTSGGTEANNTAVSMAVRARPGRSRIAVSSIEHHSIIESAEAFAQAGREIVMIPVTADGCVDGDACSRRVDDETSLLSVMTVNNETGVIQPVQDLVEHAHSVGALVHTDAVQAVGKLRVSVERLGVDLLTISAHKFHGPKGMGALWIRPGLEVEPLMRGGSQEGHRRGGTENVAGIVGLGAAAELARVSQPEMNDRIRKLRDGFESEVTRRIPDCTVNGGSADRVASTSNIWFRGAESEALIALLDLEEVYCSSGSACAASSPEPSHVLAAMGLPHAALRESIRVSLSRLTTEDDIRRVVDLLPALIERLRAMPPAESTRGNR